MKCNVKLLSVLGIALLVLAGCDDDDVISAGSQSGSGGGGAGGGGGATTVQDRFGASFAAAFNAAPTDAARALAELVITFNGVTGVNPTAAPVDL